MKPGIIFSIIFYLTVHLSCSKPTRIPVAVLNFKYVGTADYMEWEEVTGGRHRNTGNLYITAHGFDYENFHLQLENIVTTGIVSNITAKNMSFSNNYGFHCDTLRSVILEITTISNSTVHGKFEVSFGVKNSTQQINATGAFSIHEQEQ